MEVKDDDGDDADDDKKDKGLSESSLPVGALLGLDIVHM